MLPELLSTLLLGLLCGALGHTIGAAYWPGMLLAPYYHWLERHFLNHPVPWRRWLGKPLGGCAFCQTAWVAVGAWFFFPLGIACLPLCVGAACCTVLALQRWL